MRVAPVVVALLALVAVGALVPAATAVSADFQDSAGAEIVLESAAGNAASTAVASGSDHVEPCAAEPPADFEDPEENVIGWSNGYWYNEPLDIDQSDGLNESELDAFIARTEARFEALRCIQSEDTPPVELQSREEFVEEQEELFADVNESERQFDNAKFETMLMIGAEEDSIDVREANRGAAVLGYYDPVGERVVVISEDDETLQMDELTLAHELGHAIQDQQFDLLRFDGVLRDVSNAEDGLIEGDVHLIEHRYQQRCEEGVWECEEVPQAGDEGIDLASEGLYLMDFQPYSDGTSFAEELHDRGGWDAVNEAYDDPPTTSRHIVEPETYPDFEPVEVEVAADPGEEWAQIETPEGPDYDRLGPASIGAMFMGPTLATQGQGGIVDIETIYNLDDQQQVDGQDPFNFQFAGTTGWLGDRFVAYEADNETASAWTIEWESEDDAQAFVNQYADLATYRGGDHLEDRELTYEFGADSEFEGTVAVVFEESTTTILHGTDLDTVQSFNDAAATEIEPEDDDTVGTDDGTDDADDEVVSEDDAVDEGPADDTTDADDEVPGFGVGAAVLGLLGAMIALGIRRRH